MSRGRILVVEDESDIASVVSHLLRHAGFEVETVANGLEALQFLGRNSADLILLDLTMPEMDGVEFRRKQLENPEWKKIPTVLMSADDAESSLLVDAHLKKPFEVTELYGVVSGCLERKLKSEK